MSTLNKIIFTTKNYSQYKFTSGLVQNCEFRNIKFTEEYWGQLRKKTQLILKNVTFYDCHFISGSFKCVDFENVKFENCNFKGTKFYVCDFKNVQFNSKMTGCVFFKKYVYEYLIKFPFIKTSFLLEKNINNVTFNGFIRNVFMHGLDDIDHENINFSDVFKIEKCDISKIVTILKNEFGENEIVEELSELSFFNYPYSQNLYLDLYCFKKIVPEDTFLSIRNFIINNEKLKNYISYIP